MGLTCTVVCPFSCMRSLLTALTCGSASWPSCTVPVCTTAPSSKTSGRTSSTEVIFFFFFHIETTFIGLKIMSLLVISLLMSLPVCLFSCLSPHGGVPRMHKLRGPPLVGAQGYQRFPLSNRPDMTSAVDWALKANDLSIPLSKPVVGPNITLHAVSAYRLLPT